MTFRVVMLGDIVGRPGRLAVRQLLPAIRERWRPDVVIANAENAAQGLGLTPAHYDKLCEWGVDGITLGDHVYKKAQIVPTLEANANIIRPANLPAGAKGRRWMALRSTLDPAKPPLYVITVLGRIFTSLPANDPFATVDDVIAQLPQKDPMVLVEVHAEATSEKQALGWYLDGRASAVLGSHTHVPTADLRILPKGAAFMCDLGMCGPFTSVLGREVEPVVYHMTTAMHRPFEVAEADPRVCGAFVEIDEKSRRAVKVERIELHADASKPPFTA